MEYSRYEKARMIGARALQLSRGAPGMTETNLKDPKEIAELEFERGVLPIEIRKKVQSIIE